MKSGKPCASGGCSKEATVRITFIDGHKLSYCATCAAKIGGEQAGLEDEDE